MSSVFGILHTGRSAILAQQKGIEVTGQNIANVNTPGYTRQRLNLVTGIPIPSSAGPIGTGVEAKEVEKIYDRFLGTQINNEMQDLGKWEAQKEALEMTEIVFNEASGRGLNQAMSEFWNAWQDLANDPSGHVQRMTLLGKSENLAYQFQQVYDALSPMFSPLDARIEEAVDAINLNAAHIADLNQKIVAMEASGDNANEYRDERHMAVNEISSLIDVTVFEREDGSVTLKLGDGNNLVDASNSSDLKVIPNESGHNDVFWATAPNADLNDHISSGKIKGFMDARDVIIPEYMTRLENLADAIMTEVNEIHENSFGLDGLSGRQFFEGSLTNGNFSVSSIIAGDTDKIAAAETAAGAPGDNSAALAIAELQDKTVSIGGANTTFGDFYNAIVSDVGADVRQTINRFENQAGMLSHLEARKEAISGVSLDEEMINLIKFQRGYEAAAKLIKVADELLGTLINTL